LSGKANYWGHVLGDWINIGGGQSAAFGGVAHCAGLCCPSYILALEVQLGSLSIQVFRPHRMHAVHINVARILWSAVCWAHRWAMQKRLNRSRRRLGQWRMQDSVA